MEDFITDIYKTSFIISDLKKHLDLTAEGCFPDARDLYNATAVKLENLLTEISASDVRTATIIQEIALKIKASYDDESYTAGMIEGKLIPALYIYMKSFNTISVSEGRYSLRSTDTGYLTVYDESLKLYLHDIFDPMHEAFRIVRSIYRPEIKEFHILGSGLGYIPFQVFDRSEGAVKIYLYEDDETMLRYALDFGVLSLIPDDVITIIREVSVEATVEKFVDNTEGTSNVGIYISPCKKKASGNACGGKLGRFAANYELKRFSYKSRRINLWKNKELSNLKFTDIMQRFPYDEWIVISAGPSLDDSIAYLKKSKGKRGLIAVNTVLKRLISEDIIPDVMAAADSLNELERHIKGIEDFTLDIPLIADWLLSWKYTYLYKGGICFVRTNESESITEDIPDMKDVWDIGGTVASLALESVVRLGAKKVYLAGQDLAYPGGQHYAKGMPYEESQTAAHEIMVPSADGAMVPTCEAFIWFRQALEYQIKKYSHVEFINLSQHGAYIEGAKHVDPLTL